MKFFSKLIQEVKHQDIFSDIYGRNVEKAILKSALHASKPVHVLLNGPPGNNKTGFLRAIEKKYNTALFLNFTSASGPGTMTDIFQRRPKILLIDEIEKAPKNVRAVLLDLMENGRITYTLKKEKIDVTDLDITVIATCNHIDKLAPEFLDRMQVVNVKPYDFEEYVRVAVFRLRQEGISADLADYMVHAAYDSTGRQNIRALVRIARMARTQHDVDRLIGHISEVSE